MIGKVIQHYQIVEKLGEGGMGQVYKAFDTKLERFVAIKLLNPNLISNQIFLERFRTEGKNHAKLAHPNIVLVYGFIEFENLIGLVIEYVEGFTIEYLIKHYHRLNLLYSLKIVRQVLIALEYAHSKGLIHRDLKPSNIIIDNNGIAKIMDFGISKFIFSKNDLTKIGRNLGTILYMSPEQINNQQSTEKTDLYSLAVTLYEMLCGEVPFYSDNEFKIYQLHLKSLPPKLSEKFSDIPEQIDELILSAMNKSPSINFSNAFEFRNAVEELIFSLPVKINQISASSEKKLKYNNGIRRKILIPIFLLFLALSLMGVSYLVIKNYLPEEEKIIKKNISVTQSDLDDLNWQKLAFNSNYNLIDLIFINDKFYITDELGNVYLFDKDMNLILTKSVSNSRINKIIGYHDKLILIEHNGKIFISDFNLNIIKVFDVTIKNILSADLFEDKLYFCGGDGLIGKLDFNDYSTEIFKNLPLHDFLDIKILNQNNLLAISWKGYLVKSTDGGISWIKLNLSSNYLKKISVFSKQDIIYISAVSGKLYYSNDFGENWVEHKLSIPSTINDIYFYDVNNYYGINTFGDFIYTTDAGLNWSIKKTGFYLPLNKIISDGKNLYIIGNNGLILKRKI